MSMLDAKTKFIIYISHLKHGESDLAKRFLERHRDDARFMLALRLQAAVAAGIKAARRDMADVKKRARERWGTGTRRSERKKRGDSPSNGGQPQRP